MSTQINHLCKSGRGYIPNATFPVQKHWPFGSREEDILRVLTLYGRIGQLGHVTINICYKFTPLDLGSLNMKFEFSWPGDF